MSYDILVSPSLNRLDDSIINSLKAINVHSTFVGLNKTATNLNWNIVET